MTTQTTCPICHTVFRISPLSLGESKGMVQCGVCGMVFDALQNSDSATDSASVSNLQVEQAIGADENLIASLAEPLFEKSTAPSEPAQPIEQQPEIESSTLSRDTEYSNDDESVEPPLADTDAGTPKADSSDSSRLEEKFPEVSFVNKPSHRHVFMWATLSFVLCILLSGQFAILYRDRLAASFPDLAPAINALCRLTNCRVQLPADLNLIKITSTTFEADTVNPNLISVHIGLENQSDMRIALPNLALSLTNDAEEIVAKRNFSPNEYLLKSDTPAAGIAPKAEITAHLVIDADGVSASGYKISTFYNQK